MNKKKILIGCMVILLTLIFIFIMGRKSLDVSLEKTTVFKGNFEVKYQTIGYVNSKKHYVYVNDFVNALYVEKGQYVKKGDKLFDKTVSSVNGYVEDINEYVITIRDEEFYIEAYLPYEKFILLKKNTKYLFVSNEIAYNIELKNKYYLGVEKNNVVLYRVSFQIDNIEDLIFNQSGNIIISITDISDCLMVDKRAVLNDSKGNYLLNAKFNDNFDVVSNRVDIKVLMQNDDYAYISGVGIENMNVCILDDATKRLVND